MALNSVYQAQIMVWLVSVVLGTEKERLLADELEAAR
jgi:hypothetical protein